MLTAARYQSRAVCFNAMVLFPAQRVILIVTGSAEFLRGARIEGKSIARRMAIADGANSAATRAPV